MLQDELLFTQVYKLIYNDNPKIAWHAAWVIDHASEVEPSRLEPYIPELIDRLPHLKNSSLRRHFTRMLTRHEIPEEKLGPFVDVLYDLLNPSEAIAVKAHVLQLLYQIALKEPDLQHELFSVLESMLEVEQSKGMISKGRKILKSLKHQ